MNRDSIPTRRRGKGEMGVYGNEQRQHTTQGEVRGRWENMGMNIDIIPTQRRGKGEMGEYGNEQRQQINMMER